MPFNATQTIGNNNTKLLFDINPNELVIQSKTINYLPLFSILKGHKKLHNKHHTSIYEIENDRYDIRSVPLI